MVLLQGIGLLIMALATFSLFSRYAPLGDRAMKGLASAAVASFLVEAIHVYITGDFVGIEFLRNTGLTAGSMGGPAAAILVAMALGTNPVLAVVVGISVAGSGILAGFVAGYLCSFIAKLIEAKLPEGIDVIIGAVLLAPCAYLLATYSGPIFDRVMALIGNGVLRATDASPYVMGFILGGLIKMICTSPLSSMALTAILGLTGLPMGIAAIACVGGSFTNGIIFKRFGFGDNSRVAAVMLEPLTQADIISRHAFKVYSCNFFGGAFAGLAAVYFNIINNAPGTAAPIPGLLAPFAFNNPLNVILAIIVAAIAGTLAGVVTTSIHLARDKKKAQQKLTQKPKCCCGTAKAKLTTA